MRELPPASKGKPPSPFVILSERRRPSASVPVSVGCNKRQNGHRLSMFRCSQCRTTTWAALGSCGGSASGISSATSRSRFGFELHPQDIRWAAAEGVSQDVIAAVLLLHERSVDDIAPQLNAVELEQVIMIVGRSPRLYARGTLEALESKRATAPAAETVPSNDAARGKEPAPDDARAERQKMPANAGVGDSLERRVRPFLSLGPGARESPPEPIKDSEAPRAPPKSKAATRRRLPLIFPETGQRCLLHKDNNGLPRFPSEGKSGSGRRDLAATDQTIFSVVIVLTYCLQRSIG